MALQLRKFFGKKKQQVENFHIPSERELIQQEAKVGSKIFGLVPPDRRREFFYLGDSTWIWYEEWTDEAGYRQAVTTRYQIRGSVILKTQGDHYPEKVVGDELRNFHEAIRSYYYRVAKEVYHRPVRA